MNRFKFQWLLKENLYFCLALIATGYGFRGKNDWLSSQQKNDTFSTRYIVLFSVPWILFHITPSYPDLTTNSNLSVCSLVVIPAKINASWLDCRYLIVPRCVMYRLELYCTYNTEDKGSVTKPFSEQKSLNTFLHYRISHSEISLEPDVHSRKHMARGCRSIF